MASRKQRTGSLSQGEMDEYYSTIDEIEAAQAVQADKNVTPPKPKPDNLPVPRQLSATAICEEAEKRVQSIFDKHAKLKALLKEHGNTFEKRWMKNKKADEKRIASLKKAYPGIPERRLLQEPQSKNQSQDAENEFRKLCLAPSLNVSDLITGNVVLESTYHRAENDPCDFAKGDLLSTSIEWNGDLDLTVLEKDGQLIQLFDQRTVNGYGEVLSAEMAKRPSAIGLELGLLLLEIQDWVYGFHLTLVEDILANDFENLKKNPKGPMQDVAEFQERVASQESPLSGYRPLRTSIFQRLERLATEGQEERMKALINLRTDPRSFLSAFSDAKTQASKEMSSALIARDLILNIMEDIIYWRYTRMQLLRLYDLVSTNALYDATGNFTVLASILLNTLEQCYRHFCQPCSELMTPSPKTNQAKRQYEELKALLLTLDNTGSSKFNSLDTAFIEVQRFLESNPNCPSMMTETGQRRLAQHGFALELRKLVQSLTLNASDKQKGSESSEDREQDYFTNHLPGLKTLVEQHCCRDPFTDRYIANYAAKPSILDSKDGLNEVNRDIGWFWEYFDEHMGYDFLRPVSVPDKLYWPWDAKHRQSLLEGPFVEVRSRAEDILGGVDEPKRDRRAQRSNRAVEQAAKIDETTSCEPSAPVPEASRVHIAGEGMTAERPERPKPSNSPEKKKKSRAEQPATNDEMEVNENDANNEQTITEEPKIQVDNKTRDMLRIAFRCSRGSVPGEVDYYDIVHMMRGIGFESRPNHQGGHAFFKPGERIPIGLHRPHGRSTDGLLHIVGFFRFVGHLQRKYSWFQKEHFDLD